MAIAPQILAQGQLGSSKATLYTCPTGSVAYVKFMPCLNTAASSETVVIYAKKLSGTSRVLGRAVLEQWEKFTPWEAGEVVVLTAGDVIEAETTNGSAVDFSIFGAVET